jgi:hypothetical protein
VRLVKASWALEMDTVVVYLAHTVNFESASYEEEEDNIVRSLDCGILKGMQRILAKYTELDMKLEILVAPGRDIEDSRLSS